MRFFKNMIDVKFDELFESAMSNAKYRYLDDNKNINVHNYVNSRLNDAIYQGYKKQLVLIDAKQSSIDYIVVVIYLGYLALLILGGIFLQGSKCPLVESPLANFIGGSVILLSILFLVNKLFRASSAEQQQREVTKNLKMTPAYIELETVREYIDYIQDVAAYNSVQKVADFVTEQIKLKRGEK